MRLTLDTPEAARQALEQASWLHRPAVSAVEVRMPGLAETEWDRSAEAIRRLFNHDGWRVAGAVLLGLAVALAVLWVDAGGPWWAPGAATLLCLSGALGGRLLALAASRHRLRLLLRHLVALGVAAGPVDRPVPAGTAD